MTAPVARSDRDSVYLLARVAGAPCGGEARYVVRNLSATGACIAVSDALDKGDQLTATIGELRNVAADVIWARGGYAGLRFARPINVAAARKTGPKGMAPATFIREPRGF